MVEGFLEEVSEEVLLRVFLAEVEEEVADNH
jgi:C4-type Zn-finger protein